MNGALVHARRVAAGLTVSSLADRVGVHAAVIWAIEEGDERQLEQLPLTTIVALSHSLDLHPCELFADQDAARTPPPPPSPDDVVLEAALLHHGATVTGDELALVLGWPLTRLETALTTLDQRLRPTGAHVHPVGTNTYVIAPNRRALTADQWLRLGNARSARTPLTVDAATVLYHLIQLQASRSFAMLRRRSAGPTAWRTDDWDDGDEGLRQLREHGLVDGEGSQFFVSRDVLYSLGLD